jgi:hypothetical protein
MLVTKISEIFGEHGHGHAHAHAHGHSHSHAHGVQDQSRVHVVEDLAEALVGVLGENN